MTTAQLETAKLQGLEWIDSYFVRNPFRRSFDLSPEEVYRDIIEVNGFPPNSSVAHEVRYCVEYAWPFSKRVISHNQMVVHIKIKDVIKLGNDVLHFRERLPDGRGNTYDIQARSSISPVFTEIVMEMHLVKPPHYQEVFYVLTQFTQHIGIDTSGFDVFSAIKLTAQLAFGVPDSR